MGLAAMMLSLRTLYQHRASQHTLHRAPRPAQRRRYLASVFEQPREFRAQNLLRRSPEELKWCSSSAHGIASRWEHDSPRKPRASHSNTLYLSTGDGGARGLRFLPAHSWRSMRESSGSDLCGRRQRGAAPDIAWQMRRNIPSSMRKKTPCG